MVERGSHDFIDNITKQESKERNTNAIKRLVNSGLASPIEYGVSHNHPDNKIIGCMLGSSPDGLEKVFFFATGDMSIVQPIMNQGAEGEDLFKRYLSEGILITQTHIPTEEQAARGFTAYDSPLLKGLPFSVVASNRDVEKVAVFAEANNRVKDFLEDQINGLPKTITANNFLSTVDPFIPDNDPPNTSTVNR